MSNIFLCGVARAVITPEVGCCLYGYSPDIISTTVNDDLTATAFYFEDGEKSAMMISFTLGTLSGELSDKIRDNISKAQGISVGNILLCATHTHSGPNTTGNVGWGDVDEKYVNGVLLPAVYKIAAEAKASAVPATVGLAQGLSYVGVNRRELLINNKIWFGQNPWGCFNPNMTVISFKNGEGKVFANIIHYGCHCTAAGANTEISRDWAGPMIDKLEEISGGMTAFFNGPEGDVGPRIPNGKTVGMNTVKEAIGLGGVAASDAVAIWRQIKVWREISLETAATKLEIPLKPRIPFEEAKSRFEEINENANNIGGQKRNYYKRVCDSYADGYAEKESKSVEQCIVRLGDAAFVGFSYELFSEIAMRIDQASAIPYVLGLSNTNGCDGYFPTEDQICRGGYEIDMWKTSGIQAYRDDADYSIVIGTLENLKEVE